MRLVDLFHHLGTKGVCSSCGTSVPEAPGVFGLVLCAPCRATNGALAQQSDEVQRERSEAAERARRHSKLSAVLNEVPADYRGLTLHSGALAQRITRQEAITEAHTALCHPFVTIAGSHGSGKSTLASALVGSMVDLAVNLENRTAIELARNAHWVSFLDLIRDRTKYALGRGESPLVEMACDASLLVLDELGLDPLKSEGSVYHVIHHRRAHGLSTIITTGFPRTGAKNTVGLSDWYGGGMARRVSDERVKIIMCSKGLNTNV